MTESAIGKKKEKEPEAVWKILLVVSQILSCLVVVLVISFVLKTK